MVPNEEEWRAVVRATMCNWIRRYFAPGDGVEFLWRARYKADLVSEFVAHEPWIAQATVGEKRRLLIESLQECGYECVLADATSRKKKVRFPDGRVHRVTGVVVGIRRKKSELAGDNNDATAKESHHEKVESTVELGCEQVCTTAELG